MTQCGRVCVLRISWWYYCVDRHQKNLTRVSIETQLVTSDCLYTVLKKLCAVRCVQDV